MKQIQITFFYSYSEIIVKKNVENNEKKTLNLLEYFESNKVSIEEIDDSILIMPN